VHRTNTEHPVYAAVVRRRADERTRIPWQLWQRANLRNPSNRLHVLIFLPRMSSVSADAGSAFVTSQIFCPLPSTISGFRASSVDSCAANCRAEWAVADSRMASTHGASIVVSLIINRQVSRAVDRAVVRNAVDRHLQRETLAFFARAVRPPCFAEGGPDSSEDGVSIARSPAVSTGHAAMRVGRGREEVATPC